MSEGGLKDFAMKRAYDGENADRGGSRSRFGLRGAGEPDTTRPCLPGPNRPATWTTRVPRHSGVNDAAFDPAGTARGRAADGSVSLPRNRCGTDSDTLRSLR